MTLKSKVEFFTQCHFTSNRLRENIYNPLDNLRKEQVELALDSFGVDIDDRIRNKSELENKLKEHLHGMKRPPLLFVDDLSVSLDDINCSSYEICLHEPLHDLTNMAKEIMVEYKRCHSGMAKEMYIRNMSFLIN